MMLHYFANGLVANSCNFADINDESAESDVFIEGVDGPIWHSLCKDKASNPLADLTDIAIHAESLLSTQK